MDRNSLLKLSVSQLLDILRRLGASPRGARTKKQLVDRVMLELRVRRDLAAIRDGAKP